MFAYIYYHFDLPGFFRLFGYVSFRSLLAAVTAMLVAFFFGDSTIEWLRALKFGETIRSDGPSSHRAKAGTPTMGGILILGSLTIACMLFGNLENPHFTTLLMCTLMLGAIGFADDYTKVVKKNKNGLRARTKMGLTILVAAFFIFEYWLNTPARIDRDRGIDYQLTSIFIPFFKEPMVALPLALAVVLWLVVILGSIHGVNLTDGLDGLAIGNVSIVAATFAVLAYIAGTPRAADYLNLPFVENAHEIAVFLSALAGAGIGFLWFNAPPARVFMGDTGSLGLGGAVGMTAILLKKELLLVITGGIFVVEALSVILQVASFKLTGKRIFRMAPIHHHFELGGWPETRVVVRFWLIGIILGLLSLSTLRIQ